MSTVFSRRNSVMDISESIAKWNNSQEKERIVNAAWTIVRELNSPTAYGKGNGDKTIKAAGKVLAGLQILVDAAPIPMTFAKRFFTPPKVLLVNYIKKKVWSSKRIFYQMGFTCCLLMHFASLKMKMAYLPPCRQKYLVNG